MDFELEGYEMICKNRENKNGGGVDLFVDKNLTYKVVENMSTVINDVFECVTIELLMEKKEKHHCELHVQNSRLQYRFFH